MTTEEVQKRIEKIVESIGKMLIMKNTNYGNSAIEPINIFSKEGNINSILVRLDDKLGRIKNSTELRKNDISDIMGYLILLCVVKNWTDFLDLVD